MYPTDDWIEALNFYLIVASAGELTMSDFSDAQLAAAWQKYPGMTSLDLDPAAQELVLEFQAKAQDTEAKNSPIGETKELPNGAIPISMLGVPADF